MYPLYVPIRMSVSVCPLSICIWGRPCTLVICCLGGIGFNTRKYNPDLLSYNCNPPNWIVNDKGTPPGSVISNWVLLLDLLHGEDVEFGGFITSETDKIIEADHQVSYTLPTIAMGFWLYFHCTDVRKQVGLPKYFDHGIIFQQYPFLVKIYPLLIFVKE